MVNVIKNIERINKELIYKLSQFSSATVYEANGQRGAMFSYIKPIDENMKICGSACTVLSRAGDNLMLHKAISVAQPGDILVVNIGEYQEAGAWGEIATVAAMERGISGLVIDGGVRDTQAVKSLGFPVFCRSVSIKATTKKLIGFINHPITCAGVSINPGDIVLGDADGVVVVRKEDVEEVIKKAEEREKFERGVIEGLKQGKLTLDLLNLRQVLEREGLKEE
ncbi:MAG: 4-carboxy-4-hydroxy-2-oxoadipate aldolase/oxaloacetate decarboxylase [Dictyoglomi bacterium]|nr:4-carboxy-4-hydroxy-2-oxoadipate aldolase/oxaloacetate decarboxylase [Dictyoglomota bacterium]